MSILSIKKFNRREALIVVGLAVTAGIVIGVTRASGSFVAVEPESSTITAPATIGSDAAASAGKYLQFSSAAPTGGGTATGASYYVDCTSGADTNDGKSQATAWLSLAKANTAALVAGDGIFFKRGCTWSGNLAVKWNGTATAPIIIGA